MLSRLLKGALVILLGQGLNIVGNVLLVPLFLSRWPVGIYGEWTALYAMVAYLSISDFGMNSAATNELTAAYARGNLAQYRYLQGSAMAFYISVALAGSLLFGAALILWPVPIWVGVHQIPLPVAKWVVWLLALRVLWQMPASHVGNIYRTMGDVGAAQWFVNLQSAGLITITCVVLISHGSVLAVTLSALVPLILVTVFAWWILARKNTKLLPTLRAARFSGVRELVKPSLLFAMITIALAMGTQGPVLIVSATLGGTAVALLVTTRTLANVIRQLSGLLTTPLWTEITRLDALTAADRLRLGHRLMVLGSTALSAAIAGTLWFEGGAVLSVWTHGKLTPDIWLLRCFLLALVLQAPWMASSLFTAATNQHRKLAVCYSCAAAVMLGTISVLIPFWGIRAVPLGAIVGEAVVCYHFVIQDTCKVLGEEYLRYCVRLWTSVAAISLAGWAGGFIAHLLAVGPMPLRWVQVGACATTATLVSAYAFGMQKEDRLRIVRWARVRRPRSILVRAEPAI